MSNPQEINHEHLQQLFGLDYSNQIRHGMIEYGLITDALSVRLRDPATLQVNGSYLLWEDETKFRDGKFAVFFAEKEVVFHTNDIDCYPLLGQQIILYERKQPDLSTPKREYRLIPDQEVVFALVTKNN